MSDSLINILIRARVDIQSAITEARNQINGLGATINSSLGNSGGTQQINQLNASLHGTHESGSAARDGLQNVNQGLASVRDAIPNTINLFKALAVTLVGVAAIDYLKNAAQTAARAEVLGTVLHVVGQSAGYTTGQLDRVDASVQKMGITAISSRQSITQFIQAGLDLSKVAELARAAQDLAVVAGQNSSDTFARLITNIQQMDTLGLRYMGVIVNTELAMKAYAQTVGKTASELNQHERQQAFLNATLTESAKLAGTYEKSMGNVGKQVQTLARLQEDLKESIGKNLLPAYLALVEEFSAFLKESKLVADAYGEQGEGAKNLSVVIKTLAVDIHSVASFILKYGEIVATVIKTYAEVYIITKGVSGLAAAWRTVAVVGGEAAIAFGPILSGITLAVGMGAIIGTTIGNWLQSFTLVQKVADVMVANLALGFAEISDWIEKGTLRLERFGAVSKAVATGDWGNLGKIWDDYGKKIDAVGSKTKAAQQLADDARKAYENYDSNSEEAATKKASTEKELKNAMMDKVDLYAKIAASDSQIAQIKATGTIVDQEALDIATKTKDKLDEQFAAKNRIIEAGTKELKLSYDQIVDLTVQATAEASLAKSRKDNLEAANELKDSLQKTGLFLTGIGESALILSPAFLKLKGEAELYGNALLKAIDLKTPANEALISIDQVTTQLQKMVAGANTPDELIAAMTTLDKYTKVASESIQRLRENVAYKYSDASIKELDEAVSGLTRKQKELADATARLNAIENERDVRNRKLSDTILAVGGTSEEAAGHVMALGDSLAHLGRQDSALASALNTKELKSHVDEAKILYDKDLANLAVTERAKRAYIEETSKDSKDSLTKISALEKESVATRIAITQTYTNALQGQLDKALQLYQQYQEKVNSFKEAEKSAAIQQQDFLNNINRAGMFPQEVVWDKQREAQDLASQAERARLQGDFDLAKDLAQKRLTLEQDIANTNYKETKVKNIEQETQAYGALNSIIKEGEVSAQKGVDEQIRNYTELNNKLEGLGTKLMGLTKEQIRLQINFDSEGAISSITKSLRDMPTPMVPVDVSYKAIQDITLKIREAIEAIRANVSVSVTTVQGKAGGGFISGPPPNSTDTLLAWFTPGEFVLRTEAVKRYGSDMITSMNNLTLPKYGSYNFSGGGAVVGAGNSTEGGIRRDVVDVNFNIGKESVKLSGDRDQVRKLAKAMTNVQRGVA